MTYSTRTADEFRAMGYPEEAIPHLVAEDEAYAEFHRMGHRIVEIGERMKQQGGDHDYDGIINAVWRGIHEAAGIEGTDCMVLPTADPCSLSWAASQPKTRRRKTIGAAKRKRIMERDAYRCVTCGSHQALALDHIIPWSKGGSDDDDNLQTMCTPCNSRKGAKL